MSFAASGSSNHASLSPSGSASARPESRSAPARQGAPSPASRPARRPTWKKGPRNDAQKPPDPILFQTYFKSVGPRTYAAQLKRAGNGNHYLVFTEGKRDRVTDEVHKTSLYVFSEDFVSFFKLLKETAECVKSHPLPPAVAEKRKRYWQKQQSKPAGAKS